MNPTPLFDAATVHEPRKFAVWTTLAAAAGFVNAVAFAACQRYVTHVTGTVTNIGMDALNPILALEYILVLVAFVLGAFSSVYVSESRSPRAVIRPWAPLSITASLLLLAGLLGFHGYFGRFGGEVETPPEFALLSLLAFGMGLQNAGVATATGMLVRTTHMTGPATDLGVAIAGWMRSADAESKLNTGRSVLLRTAKIVGFTVGALLGIQAAARLEFLAFLVPGIVVGAIAGTTFRESRAARARS
jgi:uncharacterized membrane protein YoaK (UPF0700 family)